MELISLEMHERLAVSLNGVLKDINNLRYIIYCKDATNSDLTGLTQMYETAKWLRSQMTGKLCSQYYGELTNEQADMYFARG